MSGQDKKIKDAPCYFLSEVPNTEEGKSFVAMMRKYRNPAYHIRCRGNGRNEAAVAAGMRFDQSSPLEYAKKFRVYIQMNPKYEVPWGAPGRYEGWSSGYNDGQNSDDKHIYDQADLDNAYRKGRDDVQKENSETRPYTIKDFVEADAEGYARGHKDGVLQERITNEGRQVYSKHDLELASAEGYKRGCDEFKGHSDNEMDAHCEDAYTKGHERGRASILEDLKAAITLFTEVTKS